MRGRATVAIAAALALGTAAPATADSGRLADFGLRLTARSPGTPTGQVVHLRLRRAGDPNAKPSPLRSAVIKLPRGVRFDSRAAPQCTASDAELRVLGPDACPSNTELTVGSFTGMSGFG